MKKYLCLICLLFLNYFITAMPSIAVIDFDSGDYCTKQKATIMTDLFRNELIRLGRATIVDRKNLDKIITEMKFQMSDWVNPSKIKQIGKMIGADYLMIGHFDTLGDTLYLIVQMLDIETARYVYSSKMKLQIWDEYDWKVKDFAYEFMNKLPLGNIFGGVWNADIIHDDIIDSYTLTIFDPTRCEIKVVSLIDGAEITEEGTGTYSYDGNIFKMTAVFRNSKIPHIKNISWKSLVSVGDGNRSFNILIKPTNTSPLMKISFIKE